MNKIDLVSKEKLLKLLNFLNERYQFQAIIPISALKQENLKHLIEYSKEYLNEDIAYYDTLTNVSLNFQISELVREKILENFYEEVPHLLAVNLEAKRETDARLYLNILIVVGKKTHKAIIIGKGGSALQKLNYESCKAIKELVNKKVFIEFHVKVDEDWFNREYKLISYGYEKSE